MKYKKLYRAGLILEGLSVMTLFHLYPWVSEVVGYGFVTAAIAFVFGMVIGHWLVLLWK